VIFRLRRGRSTLKLARVLAARGKSKRWALVGCVTLLGPAGAACAGAAGEEPGLEVSASAQRIEVAFTVSNELAPRASVTVRLISDDATRILGSVTPGLQRIFEVELPASAPEYRLTATSVAFADAITSESFSLSASSAVRWRIADNALVVDRLPETSP
jgi:hypothetical protein